METKVSTGKLLKTSKDASKMLDQASETLDQVTFTVRVTVIASLLLPIRARRNDWDRFGIDQLL